MSWFWQALAWTAERIPAGWLARLGAGLGALVFSLLRIRRAHAIASIERALALSHAEATRLARRVYRHLGGCALGFLRVGGLDREAAERLIGAHGRATLDRLLAQGKGLLVLTGHLGNWDLLACAAARAGYPLHVVTREIKASGINRFWMRTRAAAGVRLHPAQGSARALVAALRRGEIVALVLDQHQPGGEVVPFFGRPAATTRSLARLARATRAPVLPAFLVEREDLPRSGSWPAHELVLEAPVPLAWSPARGEDLRRATAAFSEVLERQVRAHPSQWLWLHRRWKVGESLEATEPNR